MGDDVSTTYTPDRLNESFQGSHLGKSSLLQKKINASFLHALIFLCEVLKIYYSLKKS